MRVQCPGCKAVLNVDEESYQEKVLLQCPECLYVFLSETGEGLSVTDEGPEAPGDATLLTSDFPPGPDSREFQWNVPGASITVIEGDNQGIHRKLKDDRLVVGRKGADLAIDDKAISRNHCELIKRESGWWIKDIESTNGTFVNNKKIEEARLHHLDEIRVGKTILLFAETEAPEERAPVEEDEDSLDVTRVDEKAREKERPLPKGSEFYLEYMTGTKKSRSEKLDKSVVILGRGEEADLQIDDPGVSRKHGAIEILSRDQIYISDLASQNGIWLNGMRIRNTRLIHGDLLRLGGAVLKFIVQDVPGK